MRSGATLQDVNNNLPFWLFPKSQTQFKQITNSIPTPAAATLTEVLKFTVPAGFRFIFRGMRQTQYWHGRRSHLGSRIGGYPVDHRCKFTYRGSCSLRVCSPGSGEHG